MAWTPPEIAGIGVLVDADYMNAISGNLTVLHNPPACRVTNSTAQAISNNTQTVLAFNQESDDTDGMHSTGANIDKIFFQTAGLYLSGFTRVSFAADADGRRWARLTGTFPDDTPIIDLIGVVGAAGNSCDLSAAGIIPADAGEYQTCQVLHTAGATINVADTAVMQAHWIGGPL